MTHRNKNKFINKVLCPTLLYRCWATHTSQFSIFCSGGGVGGVHFIHLPSLPVLAWFPFMPAWCVSTLPRQGVGIPLPSYQVTWLALRLVWDLHPHHCHVCFPVVLGIAAPSSIFECVCSWFCLRCRGWGEKVVLTGKWALNRPSRCQSVTAHGTPAPPDWGYWAKKTLKGNAWSAGALALSKSGNQSLRLTFCSLQAAYMKQADLLNCGFVLESKAQLNIVI